MTTRPKLLLARKLPPNVEARATRDYECDLNPDDQLYSADQLIEHAHHCDAILCCHTEKFTADVIERLPDNVQAIASSSPPPKA